LTTIDLSFSITSCSNLYSLSFQSVRRPDSVDDRPGAPPTQPKLYKHGIAPSDTVQVLLGRGKHSDKITTSSLTSFSKKQNQGNKIMLN